MNLTADFKEYPLVLETKRKLTNFDQKMLVPSYKKLASVRFLIYVESCLLPTFQPMWSAIILHDDHHICLNEMVSHHNNISYNFSQFSILFRNEYSNKLTLKINFSAIKRGDGCLC